MIIVDLEDNYSKWSIENDLAIRLLSSIKYRISVDYKL